jgi:hypothetical protein
MSTLASRTAAAALTPPATKDALIAQYIGLMLAGQPFPAEMRPAAAAERPATVREGIERMLRGLPARG